MQYKNFDNFRVKQYKARKVNIDTFSIVKKKLLDFVINSNKNKFLRTMNIPVTLFFLRGDNE